MINSQHAQSRRVTRPTEEQAIGGGDDPSDSSSSPDDSSESEKNNDEDREEKARGTRQGVLHLWGGTLSSGLSTQRRSAVP